MPLDKDILDFIQGSFKSVWSLELMVFMQQHRAQPWSVDELVRELRGSVPVVTESLATLQASGLIAPDRGGTFRYLPASPELDRLASALERAYRERPNAVRRAILSSPNEKLQTFADAFRLKKD